MRLGLDIDGVVCEFFQAYNDWVVDTYGIPAVACDRYDWYLGYPHGGRLWAAAHASGVVEDLYGKAPVTPGAVEALASLSQAWDIHFITYRPSRLAAITSEWLDRNGMPYPTTHTDFKWQVPCDLYVDDHTNTVKDLLAHGKDALLFMRDWNKDGWGQVPTVSSWPVFSWTIA